MNFKISLETCHNDFIGDHVFTIENYLTRTLYKGTLADYNQIQFVSKSGGIVQWLSDYLNFEEAEAIYIAEQLNNWQHFINTSNNKE